MRASGLFCVTKIGEQPIHLSSITQSGKGRGESDGERSPPLPYPESLLNTGLKVRGKGFRVLKKKPLAETAKRV